MRERSGGDTDNAVRGAVEGRSCRRARRRHRRRRHLEPRLLFHMFPLARKTGSAVRASTDVPVESRSAAPRRYVAWRETLMIINHLSPTFIGGPALPTFFPSHILWHGTYHLDIAARASSGGEIRVEIGTNLIVDAVIEQIILVDFFREKCEVLIVDVVRREEKGKRSISRIAAQENQQRVSTRLRRQALVRRRTQCRS